MTVIEARERRPDPAVGAATTTSAELTPSPGMDAARAQALANRLHRGQRDPAGGVLLDHIRRVALAVPAHARTVAWLHEALEYTSISEEALLHDGLSRDELRALRLLAHGVGSRSPAVYLAHLELIAGASGPGGSLARVVKRADLEDRVLHAVVGADGRPPPYELGLEVLAVADAASDSGTDRATQDRRSGLSGTRL